MSLKLHTIALPSEKYPHASGDSIQAAIDEIAMRGGGTVELAEETYILYSSIYLRSHVCLKGKGNKTILKKFPQSSFSWLSSPAKRGSTAVLLDTPQNFYVGQGVNVGSDEATENSTTLTKIVSIHHNEMTLEHPILVSCQKNPYICSNYCAIFIKDAHHASVRDLSIDGSADSTPFIASWKIGGIQTSHSYHLHFANLEIRSTSGDGIGLGTSDYAILHKLHVHHTDQIAIHLANASRHAIVNDCKTHDAGRRDSFNGAGIFLCWNVQDCVIQNNASFNNRGGGISLGRSDDNNLFLNNHLYSNEKGNIRYRTDAHQRSKNNIFYENKMENARAILIEGLAENAFFSEKMHLPFPSFPLPEWTHHFMNQIKRKVELYLEKDQKALDLEQAIHREKQEFFQQFFSPL